MATSKRPLWEATITGEGKRRGVVAYREEVGSASRSVRRQHDRSVAVVACCLAGGRRQ
jgi:hypothetical protein